MNFGDITDRAEPGSRALPRRARRFFEALSNTRRQKGLTATVMLGASLVAEIVMRPITHRRDERLDRHFGVGTQRFAGPEAVAPSVTAIAAYDDGVAYSPTPGHRFRKILRSLPIETRDSFTFIDLGCGKGRTLLLAAELGYRRVIGIELDPDLVAAASNNVKALRVSLPEGAKTIEIVSTDATEYEFPPEPTVAFLFNPFGHDTLLAVVEAIERSLQKYPRPFFIAYYNPMHHRVLEASTLFRCIVDNPRWKTYEAIGHR